MAKRIPVFQGVCPLCGHQIFHYGVEHIVCPECLAPLNQYSSEDSDEGSLTEYDEHDGAAVAPLSDSDLQSCLNAKWEVVNE